MEFTPEQQSAYHKATAICSKSETCSFDILTKLKGWDLNEEDSRAIIKLLIEEKYIDDERFARVYVKDKFRFNNWGKQKIAFMLHEPYIKYALITLGIWGIYYTLLRIPVKSIGWFWADYSWNFFFIILIALGKIKRDVFAVLQDKKAIITLLLFAVFVNMGVFAYNLGINAGYTSVVAPIAASSSVLFVILARIFFREKLTSQQKIGIISSLAGIVILSVGG